MVPIRLRFILSLIVVSLLMGGCSYWTTKTSPDTTSDEGGFPPSDAYPPTTSGGFDVGTYHTVVKGDTLANIARRYGCTYQEIAQWNGIAPPYIIHPGQRLRVSSTATSISPMSSGSAYAYPIPKTPSLKMQPIDEEGYPSPLPFTVDSNADSSGSQYYEVQPGDSLYGIASRHGQTWQDVAAWNNIEPPYHPLQVGRRLQVSPPAGWIGSRAVSATTTGSYNSSPPANVYYNDTPVVPNKANRTLSRNTPSSGTSSLHTVQPGETLYSIAKRYGRGIAEVAAWNGLSEPYTLSVGQTLSIKAGSGKKMASVRAPAPVTNSGTSNYHIVAPGDTLYSIAKQHGQNVAQLAALNNMSHPYPPISVGQQLRVSQGASSSSFRAYGASSGGGTRSHRVKTGETLQSIARLYGTTTQELSAWNGIGHPYTVYPGQQLRIVPP